MDNSSSSNAQENQSVNPVPSVSTPLPQSTPVQPIPETPNHNYWKFAVIFLVVLVLIMGAGMVYLLQKQPVSQPIVSNTTPTTIPTSETIMEESVSDWKTYSDPAKGFTIKYPNDMTLNNNDYKTKNDSITLVKWGPSQSGDSELYDGISLTFVKINLGNRNLDDYVSTEIESSKANADILNGKTAITVNGIEGYTYTSQGLGVHKYIYLPLDSTSAIKIVDSTVDPGKLGFSDTVDKILSTLKFTDQSQNTTSDWKSFKGKVYSFDYPSNFVVKEDQTTGSNVTVSLNSNEYLHIFNIETLTYENFFECGKGADTGCLQKISDTQTDLIEDILVDGKKAKSFYVYGGPDSLTHVVEIIQPPTTQLRMSIAGGGLEKTFDQILSTFKFTK